MQDGRVKYARNVGYLFIRINFPILSGQICHDGAASEGASGYHASRSGHGDFVDAGLFS